MCGNNNKIIIKNNNTTRTIKRPLLEGFVNSNTKPRNLILIFSSGLLPESRDSCGLDIAYDFSYILCPRMRTKGLHSFSLFLPILKISKRKKENFPPGENLMKSKMVFFKYFSNKPSET